MNFEQVQTMLNYINRGIHWNESYAIDFVEDYSLLKLFLRLDDLWKEENAKLNLLNMTLNDYKEYYYGGYKFDYTFITGYKKTDKLNNNCLSLKYPCRFKEKNIEFNSVLQYYMYKKAELFKDFKARDKILNEKDYHKIFYLGKRIKGFDKEKWNRTYYNLAKKGNYLKFSQNEDLKYYLVGTNSSFIINLDSHNPRWSVGLDINDKYIKNPSHWRGSNELGFMLMRIRENYKNFP